MSSWVFFLALAMGVLGFAVAVRFLYLAWSDFRFRRERRLGIDRRRTETPVPMERRKGDRRS